eukprot:2042668-Amphidinium_carterae.1
MCSRQHGRPKSTRLSSIASFSARQTCKTSEAAWSGECRRCASHDPRKQSRRVLMCTAAGQNGLQFLGKHAGPATEIVAANWVLDLEAFSGLKLLRGWATVLIHILLLDEAPK